jgi:hypothetical protein
MGLDHGPDRGPPAIVRWAIEIAPSSPYKHLRKHWIRFVSQEKTPGRYWEPAEGSSTLSSNTPGNVLNSSDAHHAEYDPYASRLFISQLARSLGGRTKEINLVPHSGIAVIYGKTCVLEQYCCNFGAKPDFVPVLLESRLKVTGSDQDGELRVVASPTTPSTTPRCLCRKWHLSKTHLITGFRLPPERVEFTLGSPQNLTFPHFDISHILDVPKLVFAPP